MHETRETASALLVVTCLVAGVGGAVFYTLGPDGWLMGLVRSFLLDPNMGTLAALATIIAAIATVTRWLDRKANSGINNIVVGMVALGGFIVILQGLHTMLA